MARRTRPKAVRGRHTPSRPQAPAGSAPQQFVEYLARGLVDDPQAVNVAEVQRSDSTLLELRVALGDLGKVIGRNGRTAQAMRTLLSIGRFEDGPEVVLDIVD